MQCYYCKDNTQESYVIRKAVKPKGMYKRWKDVVEKVPVSSCEKYLDFGDCFPYYDICELEKIQISEENSYE